MRAILAVARYRLRETLTLKRWLVIGPLLVVGAYFVVGDSLYRWRVAKASPDVLDVVVDALRAPWGVVFVFGVIVLAAAGDALQRSAGSGALSYTLAACHDRRRWWLGEMLATATVVAVLTASYVLACAVVGGLTASGKGLPVGARWKIVPQSGTVLHYGQSRMSLLLLGLFLVWTMGVVLASITLALSMRLRAAAALPIVTLALFVAWRDRIMSDYPVRLALDPIVATIWDFYVDGIREPSAPLGVLAAVTYRLAWIALPVGVGLLAARTFEPRRG